MRLFPVITHNSTTWVVHPIPLGPTKPLSPPSMASPRRLFSERVREVRLRITDNKCWVCSRGEIQVLILSWEEAINRTQLRVCCFRYFRDSRESERENGLVYLFIPICSTGPQFSHEEGADSELWQANGPANRAEQHLQSLLFRYNNTIYGQYRYKLFGGKQLGLWVVVGEREVGGGEMPSKSGPGLAGVTELTRRAC